jgi:tetratricopeptide (TPR) repeat protein
MNLIFRKYCILLLTLFIGINAIAQPGPDEVVDKPDKFSNKQLRSEKTGEKKFTFLRRFFNNATTRYNYFFNANEKLKAVLENAKAANKDDYTKLLNYYPYTLKNTASNKTELDSIIYKSTAGILLHDLRSDWVDDMYYLIGRAYFFRNDLDSASRTFQYINFGFAPKDASGYSDPVGSNAAETGIFSIATPESQKFLDKLFKRSPVRNDAFLYQIQSYVHQGLIPEAAGLIEILKNDPNFPKRLHQQLMEVIGFWYYQQEQYDSTAQYLSQTLDLAPNKFERSRTEYLLGQLYALAGNKAEASKYFAFAQDHTFDPIMDVYARLNSIRLNGDGKTNSIDQNLLDIEKMARRDKYEAYRNIIYYAAANIALEKPDEARALNYLALSNQFNQNNEEQKTKNYLLAGDIYFKQKNYIAANNAYDSVSEGQIKDSIVLKTFKDKKPGLKIIAENLLAIQKEDSLQALAAMPQAQREAIVKKQLKALRKAAGLKEDAGQPVTAGGPSLLIDTKGGGATDLFPVSAKGEFYFYNNELKAKGFNDFKRTWGNRPNVNNWRRLAAVEKEAKLSVSIGGGGDEKNANDSSNAGATTDPAELSIESLTANIPLTDSGMTASNKNKRTAHYNIGKAFHNDLEFYEEAARYYELVLANETDTAKTEEVIFNAIYCYKKLGNNSRAAELEQLLKTKYASGKYNQQLSNPAAFQTGKQGNNQATATYKGIYDMFISGDFANALAAKKTADSVYGKHFWTPQLLYIQSIYHVRQQQDSLAILQLKNIQSQFPNTLMAEKATTMIDVLGRRAAIEEHLRKLVIDSALLTGEKPIRITNPVLVRNDSNLVKPKERILYDSSNKPVLTTTTVTTKPKVNNTIKKDSVIINTTKPVVMANYTHKPELAHRVIILLDKVDPVYVSECKNAFNKYNKANFYQMTINMSVQKLDDRYQMVLMDGFKDALDAINYLDKVKPKAANQIVPWLDATKFSFFIIHPENLTILAERKDLKTYLDFLKASIPGKF